MDESTLRQVAEKVAAGTVGSSGQSVPDALLHQALADGFGKVMLYGGVSVWLLAAASFLAFGARTDPDGSWTQELH